MTVYNVAMTQGNPEIESARMVPTGRITFVCCIEHGRLEEQTLRMLRTLRRNGGSLAGERVLVVVGRAGPPLSEETEVSLLALRGEIVRDYSANPFPWFNYANKIAAVTLAERMATTPVIAWLDSDTLVASEPDGLLLGPDIDFAGHCEVLPPAVVDEATLHRPYWQRLCEMQHVEYEDLPIVAVPYRSINVRLFINSGVFAWRRGSAFASGYREAFISLLDSRLAQHDGNFFNADQVIIGPVLLRYRLRWQHLRSIDHHMTFQSQIDGPIASPDMAGAKLVHYSKSLEHPFRERFLRRLESELPILYRQIIDEVPGVNAVLSLRIRCIALYWKAIRALRWKIYAKRVIRAPAG